MPSFKLSDTFVDDYRTKDVQWGYQDAAGNSLGEITFLRTYSRIKPDGSKERWHEVCRRVIEWMFSEQKDHCKSHRLPWNDNKAQRSAQDAYDRMFHFKWTPPGRGLWIAGTPLVYDQRNSAALQNCFRGTEKIVTDVGVQVLAELDGQTTKVWANGNFHKAEVRSFGLQSVQRVSFAPAMPSGLSWRACRSNHRVDVTVTPDHRWELMSGETTTSLSVGDTVPASAVDTIFDDEGFRHGLIFADGSLAYRYANGDYSHMMRLCGDKSAHDHLFETVHYQPNCDGDPVVYHRSATNMKTLPVGKSAGYFCGFIRGWLAGDGTVRGASIRLSSQDAEAIDWLKVHAALAGYVVTGHTIETNSTNFGTRSAPLHNLSLATTKNRGWKVVAIEPLSEPEVVYCAVVPGVERFTLASGIYTSNCGFVSTNDMTKNDPAAPFKWFMEALMLGVGIGFDDKGADKEFVIYEPTDEVRTYVIPDTREGWVESLGLLLETFLLPDKPRIEFDYSEIRPAGTPIKTFGGTAAGHKPLQRLHRMVIKKFSGRSGGKLSRIDIADIGNQIGLCVVAGNVRRSAELLIGHIDDKDFIDLKNYEAFPERNFWTSEESDERGWGWMCVPSDTWIMTESGPLKVQDLVGVDFKTTLSGELHAASGFWQTAKSRQVYQVTTRAGYQLEATDNHPVMTKRGWVRVDELTTSDHVLIAHHPGHKWEGNGGSFAEGYLLGAVWSDGWISGNRAHIALYGREFDLEWARYIEGCARTVGAQGGFQRPTTRGEHRLASKALKHFTDRFGFTADRKALSESIERMSSDFYCGFLSAALDGDGTIAQYRQGCDGVQVILSQSSLEDLRGIQRMLGRLGIYSTIRTGKVTGFPSRMPHSLALAARSLSATTSRLALKNPLKAERLHGASAKRAVGQPYWAQVASIIPSRCAAVYDVTIQDVHCFDANGIVVHNSNNSVKAQVGDSYSHLIDGIRLNGEPGIIWMDLSRQYGRLIDPPDNRDWRVQGYNPCAEQSLESYEMCTLVETYLNRHESLEDFQRTLKYAFMYAKTVTLVPTHWERTNAIMQRNRRIGCSVSGVANFADNRGLPELRTWLNKGYETVKRYDYVYSEWLCVRESIKMTTVKPSGTVSILAGESPGVHWAPGGAYFNRAVRLAKDSSLVPLLQQAGYTVEPDVKDPDTTMVAYFPIHTDAKRAEGDVTVFEKANLAVVAQRYWSDNSVSVTLSFNAEEEAEHIGTVLHMHEGQLKTVSFLPMGNTVYPQQPYTKISEHQYQQASQGLKRIDLDPIYDGEDNTDAVGELYCTTDSCEIKDHKLNSGS